MTVPGATSGVPSNLVVVDTDAFSRLFLRPSTPAADLRRLRDRLSGRVPVIATQTEAELRAWPLVRSWGTTRTTELTRLLDRTLIISVTAEVVDAYARLVAECGRTGHTLHQRQHTGDRWIAATAIALDRPLLAIDGVYADAPKLTLLT